MLEGQANYESESWRAMWHNRR